MREHPTHDPFERRPGRGERGPRVFAPGDLKLLLLSMLAEQPGHGYDLIRQIENLFDASYTPSPGVIYPTLNFLEEAELISGQVQGSKRLYTITAGGRSALVDQAVALEGVRMRIEVSKRALRGHDRPPQIHEAVGNLRHALHMHSGRWTPEEIERVRSLLNDTAKAIACAPADPVKENPHE
ncbi:PadR family transcriptional regulator [Pseudomonas sp.]|uniref:PadR family transcriptional regulator n=1 Tax=Pseudomonas sp. TaxID=306 RepID=UPI0028A7F8BF|nr:PadR family transcriptional regulator [Pseudomonas sp.]